MGRKRPRPPFTAQLLAVTTFAIPPLLPKAFLPFASPLFRSSAIGSTHRAAWHRSNGKLSRPGATAVKPLRAIPGRRRTYRRGWEEEEEEGDPNDPLPRTMEELYRRMQSDPPADHRPSGGDDAVISTEDEDTIAEVFDKLIAPMGDDSWWEENEEEWDRMASDPVASFTSVDAPRESAGFSWGLQGRFGESTPDWQPSDEIAAPFSLSAYKAGTALEGGQAKGGIAGTRTTSARTRTGNVGGGGAWTDPLERTPFAEYWDALPDVGVTKRVYAFNAVDRMAALKFLMNCTCNGMHGSPEDHQAGHFLWGYADQLDWMRRSGRLSNKPGSIKVDERSWWGRVSYALTIVPLAAAAEADLCDEGSVSILGGNDLQLPEMRRAVRAWRRVWRFSDADIATRVLLEMPVHDSLMERVRRAQWAAHVESLDAVEALYKEEFDALPSSAEREFARGWCRASRLLAVAAAHTNLDRLLLPLGAGYPPERLLLDSKAGTAAAATDGVSEDSLEGVPYGPLYLVEEAAADPAVALNTRRCVKSVRWLGKLRAPAFATLCFLWRRTCVSYPARLGATRVLRGACLGGRRARAAAWGKSLAFMLVPDLNYRKLMPPFGVDPAEEVEYDPNMPLRDPAKLPPRPAGSRPLNPLQWPWYDGRRPDPAAAAGGAAEGRGWDEDDDGLGSSGGGMFPAGKVPTDFSFDALQERKATILRILRKAEERRRQREDAKRSSGGEGGTRGRGAGGAGGAEGVAEERMDTDGDSLSRTVFM